MDDAESRPAGPLRFDLRLPATAIAVAAARAIVRAFHRVMDAEPLQRLELVVSELVTNAVRHGSPPHATEIGLELNIVDGWVRGSVSDSGPPFSMPHERPSNHQVGGFGLLIVDGLTDSLLIERAESGNVVHFSVSTQVNPG